MSIYSEIEEAIEGRAVIKIVYKGSARIVEPHLMGRNTKGNVCLSAFQISGGSGYSFRSFLLDEISAVTQTGDTFDEPRPGYNRNDATMIEIYVRV